MKRKNWRKDVNKYKCIIQKEQIMYFEQIQIGGVHYIGFRGALLAEMEYDVCFH